MNFTEREVIQYEILAEALNNFDYFSEDVENRFLMFILNIESLLPSSNIFGYVVKTDKHKDEKLRLQLEREELYMKIKSQYERIEEIDNRVAEMETDIENSEWKVETNSTEEIVFNSIKQKLIIEKKLNYGSI
jgi:hypothetical protein